MEPVIIFGTKRLGQSVVKSTEKYPNLAVVTVEGVKGAKKSRRVLLNRKAAELLALETGDIQEVIFASVERGEDIDRQVLIANKATVEGASDEMISYKTSKNKVSFDDSNEKGKAITSSHVCNEIFTFLSKDDSQNEEFTLTPFKSQQVDAFSLDAMPVEGDTQEVAIEDTVAKSIPVEEIQETVIADNNGVEMTGAEVQESVQAEVAKAEEASPVLQRQESALEAQEVGNTGETEDWMN